jgi:hypothetical protein
MPDPINSPSGVVTTFPAAIEAMDFEAQINDPDAA